MNVFKFEIAPDILPAYAAVADSIQSWAHLREFAIAGFVRITGFPRTQLEPITINASGPVNATAAERVNQLKGFLLNCGPHSEKGRNASQYVVMHEGCRYLIAIGDNSFPTHLGFIFSSEPITIALSVGNAISPLKGAILGFCFPQHAVALNDYPKMEEFFSPAAIHRFATELKTLLPNTTTATVLNYVLQDPLPPAQNRTVVALLDGVFGTVSTSPAPAAHLGKHLH